MLGCVAENALKNPFILCFSHFLRVQINFITENQNIQTTQETKIKTKTSFLFTNSVKRGRKSERLRDKDIGKERIGVDGGGSDQIGWVWGWTGVGLGVEWSGLVVGGGQIGDRWWRLVRWRAWWSTAYGWLSRSELVSAWLVIGKVDR